MARKNKFRPGLPLGIVRLVMKLNRGEWVYLRGRPIHPNFMINMSVITLRIFCRGGAIREAILNEEE